MLPKERLIQQEETHTHKRKTASTGAMIELNRLKQENYALNVAGSALSLVAFLSERSMAAKRFLCNC